MPRGPNTVPRSETERDAARRTAILSALPGTVVNVAFVTGLSARVVHKHLLVLKERGAAHVSKHIPREKGGGSPVHFWARGAGVDWTPTQAKSRPRTYIKRKVRASSYRAGAYALVDVMSSAWR